MINEVPYIIPGASLPGENRLPFFRDVHSDWDVPLGKSVSSEDRKHLGIDNGRRVLPYTMQDHYDRERSELSFNSVVLENDILRAVFLPGLGGRLVSLYNKEEDRELLHRNPVFQPANLAIRNAWFSGGVEWNLGYLGHSVITCSPLFSAVIRGADGEEGLRLYQFERMKRLWWQMDIFLPPGSPFLQVTTHIRNMEKEKKNLYWWTNIAVEEDKDTRVLAPGFQGLCINHKTGGFDRFDLPALRTIGGRDCSYPVNYHFSNEFFFKLEKEERPWVASVDREGRSFVEFSTRELVARKLFVWGQHQGGQHWQDFLAREGERYVEIQAGLAPTQRHILPMAGGSAVTFTELFGSLAFDPKEVHSPDYAHAARHCREVLEHNMPQVELDRIHSLRQETLESSVLRLLSLADGWGALELKRLDAEEGLDVVAGLDFPESTLADKECYWLDVLQGRNKEEPHKGFAAWQIGPAWKALLEKRLKEGSLDKWHHWLHAGVMAREDNQPELAEECWLRSLAAKENPLAARNLGYLYREQNRGEESREFYSKAWQLCGPEDSEDLLIEYMDVLIETGSWGTLETICRAIDSREIRNDRIRLHLIALALERRDPLEAEAIISREFSVIREGEASLDSLWEKIQAMKEDLGKGRRKPIPRYLDYGIKG